MSTHNLCLDLLVHIWRNWITSNNYVHATLNEDELVWMVNVVLYLLQYYQIYVRNNSHSTASNSRTENATRTFHVQRGAHASESCVRASTNAWCCRWSSGQLPCMVYAGGAERIYGQKPVYARARVSWISFVIPSTAAGHGAPGQWQIHYVLLRAQRVVCMCYIHIQNHIPIYFSLNLENNNAYAQNRYTCAKCAREQVQVRHAFSASYIARVRCYCVVSLFTYMFAVCGKRTKATQLHVLPHQKPIGFDG